MQTVRSFVGLDLLKASISISVAEDGRSGPVRFPGVIPNTADAVAKMAKRLSKHGELEFCYEASCCGYGIHRQLTALGHKCMACAPSMIPRKPGDRIKTDRRDSKKLVMRVALVKASVCSSNTYSTLNDRTLRRRISSDDNDTLYTSSGQAGDTPSNYQSTTTMTDPEGNDTVVSFLGLAPYLHETARSVYQGTGTSRVLLQSSTRCYNNQISPCGGPNLATDAITQVDDSVMTAGNTKRTTTYYDAKQLVTGMDEYGFGTSPVRKARTIYGIYGTAPHLIRDRPSSTGVQDSTSTWIAQTTFGYDQKGNQTDEYRTIDSSRTAHVRREYDLHGMVTRTEDPRRAGATRISYEATGSFPQAVKVLNLDNSQVNGVSHAMTYDYESGTGLLRSSTDPNGVTTARHYNPVGRLTSVQVAQVIDGGTSVETQFCYHLFNVVKPAGRCSDVENSVLQVSRCQTTSGHKRSGSMTAWEG